MPLVITGVRETLAALKKTVQGDTIKVAIGLNNCAVELLQRSRYYVPKDTWALHDSGRVVWNEQHGFATRFSVEYGGPVAGHDVVVDYAAVVHNDLAASHKPPTQAMYLSRASIELMPKFAREMGRVMKTTGVEGVEGMNRFGGFGGHDPRGMRS